MNVFKFLIIALLSFNMAACSDNRDVMTAQLTSDLDVIFTKKLEMSVDIEVELLRDYPTITGVALPKFYAWIKIFNQGEIVSEGVVRVAEVSKTQYDLTHYVTKKELLLDATKVSAIFPKPLVKTILKIAQG